jgi:hypothetical protein
MWLAITPKGMTAPSSVQFNWISGLFGPVPATLLCLSIGQLSLKTIFFFPATASVVDLED